MTDEGLICTFSLHIKELVVSTGNVSSPDQCLFYVRVVSFQKWEKLHSDPVSHIVHLKIGAVSNKGDISLGYIFLDLFP